MAHEHVHPVVDRALRNFLVFLLVLLAVVALGATAGAALGVVDPASVVAFPEAQPLMDVASAISA